MTIFITADDVMHLNDLVRQQYPDKTARGHVNRQAVEGIVDSSFKSLYGRPLHDTIHRQAAALLEGIIRFHPFPDGNKRTALLAACAFLEINGNHVSVSFDMAELVVGVAMCTTMDSLDLVGMIATELKSMSVACAGMEP